MFTLPSSPELPVSRDVLRTGGPAHAPVIDVSLCSEVGGRARAVVAVALRNGVVEVWEAVARACVARCGVALPGHPSPHVSAIALCVTRLGGCAVLAAGCEEGHVCLWDVPLDCDHGTSNSESTGDAPLQLILPTAVQGGHDGKVRGVCAILDGQDPDGATVLVATASCDTTVRMWRVAGSESLLDRGLGGAPSWPPHPEPRDPSRVVTVSVASAGDPAYAAVPSPLALCDTAASGSASVACSPSGSGHRHRALSSLRLLWSTFGQAQVLDAHGLLLPVDLEATGSLEVHQRTLLAHYGHRPHGPHGTR